jgi:hypothetical protein
VSRDHVYEVADRLMSLTRGRRHPAAMARPSTDDAVGRKLSGAVAPSACGPPPENAEGLG